MNFFPNFLAQGAFLSSSIVMAEELIVGPETEPSIIHIITTPPQCFNITSLADCMALYE
jgi:hypothetical protein